MRHIEMNQDRLEKLLRALPPLPNGAHCYICDVVTESKVTAVIRDPEAGDCLCTSCAVERSQMNEAARQDMEQAVRWRRFFMEKPMECVDCTSAAQRHCSYCATPLCEEHRIYIPRTGCACRECAEKLEEEQRRRNGEIW